MAKFWGPGTGANRGYWSQQWRDGKGRWIEMFSIGEYFINGVRHTGMMMGGDSQDSINVERRTAGGKVQEPGIIDKISPKDFVSLDVKATLNPVEGFNEEEMERARRAQFTRPTPASYPNGTTIEANGKTYTKGGEDAWSDSEDNSLTNADVEKELEGVDSIEPNYPEEAELTAENILNAVDGSTLEWKGKTYTRFEGKWFDSKTNRPVSDKTMRSKTEGDLRTDGGEITEEPTPTPASEFDAGTKLRANRGDSETADLEKTDENAWDITTGESSTSTDDETADKVLDAAETVDDLSDSAPEEAPAQAEPANQEATPERGEATPEDQGDLISRARVATDTMMEKLEEFYENPSKNSYDDLRKYNTEKYGNIVNEVASAEDRGEISEGDVELRSLYLREREAEEIVTFYGDADGEFDESRLDKVPENRAIMLNRHKESAAPTPEPQDQEEVTPEPEDNGLRPLDETLADLQEDGQYASEQVSRASEGDADADIEGAKERLVNRAEELLNKRRQPDTTPEERRKIDSSVDDLRRAQSALDQVSLPDTDTDEEDFGPETFSDADLEGGFEEDPEEIDFDDLEGPSVEELMSDMQADAENGELDFEEVDPTSDFTPPASTVQRMANEKALEAPEIGDIVTLSSGRQQEYRGNGIWANIKNDGPATIDNEAIQAINSNGANTVFVQGGGEENPEPAIPAPRSTNRHGIALGRSDKTPDDIRILTNDGRIEDYRRNLGTGQWHRVLDNAGNLAPRHINKGELHTRIDGSRQVATRKDGEQVGSTPPNPPKKVVDRAGLTPNAPKAEHKPVVQNKKEPLGSNITDKPRKGNAGDVLEQDGKRVGLVGADGDAYYVGDRVVYTDKSSNKRSGVIKAVTWRNGGWAADIDFDENDTMTTAPAGVSFDEWYQMSGAERKAQNLPVSNYTKIGSPKSSSMTSANFRLADENTSAQSVQEEHDAIKASGLRQGAVVETPEFLDDVSSDRVVRDNTTRIIGTTNKYGELYQVGDVVEYGPNNERGTIMHIGEADDKIRIAPDGQSALESVYHHVDTLSHSKEGATYYDKNYDAAPQDRVVNDRFNNPVTVGSTIYRYGLPFTVTDIYPDGKTIRVRGDDTTGEQGSAASGRFQHLIDLGIDEAEARDIADTKSHDFMPDHVQVFTGDINDIASVRTHDSHMMTLTRDADGDVLHTPENRAAMSSRMLGGREKVKQRNSALSRYFAENGEEGKYDSAGLMPGDAVDLGVDQAASDNLSFYIDQAFGTDLVIPDNSRFAGYNKYGRSESYTKKNNRWTIDGVEDGRSMSAQEFYQYRLENGYRPMLEDSSNSKLKRMDLTYVGDADDNVVPQPGTLINKKDAPKFVAMPAGSLVRFTDAEGNVITIRKFPDGEWRRVLKSGEPSAKTVNPEDIPGAASFRGISTNKAPAPKVDLTNNTEVKLKDVDGVERTERQARENRGSLGIERNNKRVSKGGKDRIYGTHNSGAGTYRQGYAEQTARAQAEEALKKSAEENARLMAEIEELRKKIAEQENPEAVSASGNIIVARKKATGDVLATYSHVSDNTWEHVSSRGVSRQFTLEGLPTTPGVDYTYEKRVS